MDVESLFDVEPAMHGPDTRPTILVPGSHRDECGSTIEVGTDRFCSEVLAALPPTTLFRWDFLVGELIGEPGHRRFREVNDQRMRAVVDRHVRLAKWQSRGQQPPVLTYAACRRDWGGLLLAQAGVSTDVPALSMITRYPVYAGDFELVKPGWNPDHRIYYDEPDHLVGLTPSKTVSLGLFEDLIVDFPFADEASRLNLLAILVTLIIRPAGIGNTPFFVFTAPLERTGKGKAIESIVGRALLGASVPTMQLGSKEEEREKRLTSLIVEGSTVIHLDNLSPEEVLDSPALASLATTRLWKGRLLGTTKTPQLPNNLLVIMSGNNVKATGEITKRTIPIVLHPQDDHPEDRTDFEHPDIESYAGGKQRELLADIFGLIEVWKAAGRPRSAKRLGGFEGWVQIVGGILENAGATAWMANYKQWVRRGDEFAADAEVLIGEWEHRHFTTEITATDVLEMVRNTKTFSFVTSRPEAGQAVVLARRVLTPLTDRPVGTWIVRRMGSGGSSRYRLEEQPPI